MTNSMQIWDHLFKDATVWMGDMSIEPDGSRIKSFFDLSTPELAEVIKKIYDKQHSRSYYLCQAAKDDIWDVKNLFRNQIDEIIFAKNQETDSKAKLI